MRIQELQGFQRCEELTKPWAIAMLVLKALRFDHMPVTRHLAHLLNTWLLATKGFALLCQVVHGLKGFTWVAIPHFPVLYKKYKKPHEEALYWTAAAQENRKLRASNATNAPDGLPLIVYYTPKLLPIYRESMHEDPEAREEYIAPRVFCKWHRMVHPGPVRYTATHFHVAFSRLLRSFTRH